MHFNFKNPAIFLQVVLDGFVLVCLAHVSAKLFTRDRLTILVEKFGMSLLFATESHERLVVRLQVGAKIALSPD